MVEYICMDVQVVKGLGGQDHAHIITPVKQRDCLVVEVRVRQLIGIKDADLQEVGETSDALIDCRLAGVFGSACPREVLAASQLLCHPPSCASTLYVFIPNPKFAFMRSHGCNELTPESHMGSLER